MTKAQGMTVIFLSDVWGTGPPAPGSAIVSRGKASGRMSLSGGVKGTKSPQPGSQKHVTN